MARKLDGSEAASDSSGTSDDGGGFGRREYLRMGLAATAVAGIGTAVGTAGAERAGITFDQVLDAVDDIGLDPTGERSISSAIADLPPDTLVRFPSGTYRIDERIALSDRGNVGLEATGDATLALGDSLGSRVFDVEHAQSVYHAGFTYDRAGSSLRQRWQTTERLDVRDVGTGETLESTHDASTEATYETFELEPGEQRTHTLSDGETFENVLIDQTAEGAMFVILTDPGANDWTIRNVGWKGVAPSGGDRGHTFLVNVRGEGRIENVFIDQRNHDGGGRGSDVGGIWTYSDSHDGHIDCRHNFIAGCGNNGCYDSGDGWSDSSGNGTVGHEYCYHRDNTPSNFRPGRPGSYVRDSVSIANDPEGTRGGYPANGSQLTRACWAWHNTGITMENCAIWWDPDDVSPSTPFWTSHYGNRSEGTTCELEVTDCDVNASWEAAGNPLATGDEVIFTNLGNDPSVDVLGDGVPLTPEMAAAGERGLPPEIGTAPSGGHGAPDPDPDEDPEPPEDETGGSSTPSPMRYADAEGVHTELPRELVIEHVEPGERVTYELDVDGTLEAGEFDHPPEIEAGTATGGLGPDRGLDNVYFDGDITRFEGEHLDHVRLLVADAETRTVLREFDPATFPEDAPSSYAFASGVHTDLPLELVIEHVEPGETVMYELVVNGVLESSELGDPPIVAGSVAWGGLGPEAELDTMYFDGDVTAFSCDRPEAIRLYLADAQTRSIIEELDPATFPASVPDTTELHVNPRSDSATYELTVSEALEDDPSVSFDAADNISGTNAEGMVSAETHGYQFLGDLVDVRVAGDADLVLDGEPIEPGGEFDHRISIRGVDGRSARYRFKVSGAVETTTVANRAEPARWDRTDPHLTGDMATGIVHRQADAYRFSGDIVYLNVFGPADVTIESLD